MHCVIGILQNLLLFSATPAFFIWDNFGTARCNPSWTLRPKSFSKFLCTKIHEWSGEIGCLRAGNSIMVERDIMIWNSKEFLRNPILLKEDKKIKLFRNWHSQFYSENSKSFWQLQKIWLGENKKSIHDTYKRYYIFHWGFTNQVQQSKSIWAVTMRVK